MSRSVINVFLQLSYKDLRCLMRAPGRFAGMACFVLVVVLLASLSLRETGITPEETRRLAPGLFWIINAFSAILALQYTASIEEDDSGSSGLLFTGVDSALLFASKCFTSFLLVGALQITALLMLMLFLNLGLGAAIGRWIEVSALASLSIAAVGVLLSGMASALRSQDLLLPVLLFPLILPVLAACVLLTAEALQTGSFDRLGFWYMLLCCFSVLSVSLGTILYEQVIR